MKDRTPIWATNFPQKVCCLTYVSLTSLSCVQKRGSRMKMSQRMDGKKLLAKQGLDTCMEWSAGIQGLWGFPCERSEKTQKRKRLWQTTCPDSTHSAGWWSVQSSWKILPYFIDKSTVSFVFSYKSNVARNIISFRSWAMTESAPPGSPEAFQSNSSYLS